MSNFLQTYFQNQRGNRLENPLFRLLQQQGQQNQDQPSNGQGNLGSLAGGGLFGNMLAQQHQQQPQPQQQNPGQNQPQNQADSGREWWNSQPIEQQRLMKFQHFAAGGGFLGKSLQAAHASGTLSNAMLGLAPGVAVPTSQSDPYDRLYQRGEFEQPQNQGGNQQVQQAPLYGHSPMFANRRPRNGAFNPLDPLGSTGNSAVNTANNLGGGGAAGAIFGSFF